MGHPPDGALETRDIPAHAAWRAIGGGLAESLRPGRWVSMPIKHSLWSVGNPPKQLSEGQLPSELMLHEMIKAAPELLSPDWMLIGSEVPSHGGRLDLLAVAPDGSLVLIELKRGRTPREVVAQAGLRLMGRGTTGRRDRSDLPRVAGRSLAGDFEERFRRPLVDEELNAAHEIVIVAAELDPATERIVQYLNRHGIGINVLFFRVFEHRRWTAAQPRLAGRPRRHPSRQAAQLTGSPGTASTTSATARTPPRPGRRPASTASSLQAAGPGTRAR